MATKEEIIAQRQFSTERYVLSTLPVLYTPLYRLDGSLFLSGDGTGHIATVTGGVWSRQGWIADGDDKITIPDHTAFAWGTATDYTWLVWINTTANMALGVVIDKSQNTPRIYHRIRIRANANGGVVDAYISNVSETTSVGVTKVNDGAWHLIGFSHKRGVTNGAVIYVNGKVDGQADGISVNLTNTQKLGIGQSDNQADNAWFNGRIGSSLVYNRILSQAEIQHIYEITKWRYK